MYPRRPWINDKRRGEWEFSRLSDLPTYGGYAAIAVTSRPNAPTAACLRKTNTHDVISRGQAYGMISSVRYTFCTCSDPVSYRSR